MTTLEPGARVVLTHGLRFRPRSTAFLASSAAPTMTWGLDVFVHEVMAAMTTAPWSISHAVPSSRVSRIGLLGRSATGVTLALTGLSPLVWWSTAGGSLA